MLAAYPKLSGDAGILVDQTPESLAGGIKLLLDDRDKRDQLGKQGYQRSLKFTWDESARKNH